MNRIVKKCLLGLLAGCISFVVQFIPFALLFAPGFIFGIFMVYEHKTLKDKLSIVGFSGLGYIVAMWIVAYSGLNIPPKALYVLGGVFGGVILGIGFRLRGIIENRDVFMLGILSALIAFFMSFEYYGWVSFTPEKGLGIIFPVWQSFIALYLAFSTNEEKKSLEITAKNQY